MTRLAFGVALLWLVSPAALVAQDAAVFTGQVQSASLAEVAGAYVSIPGVDATTITNDAGRYRLTVPAEEAQGQSATMTVELIGYQTREVDVTLSPGVNVIDVTLSEEAIALDELMVTGTAGRQERRAQAAVVSQIDAAELAETAPVNSVSNMLQARNPGVSITKVSGSAGTASRIRIRGMASVELSNSPLVFIDGVRADARSEQIYGVSGQEGSRLNDIRPEDIESIEIVKGPAAATLYGADASAGVIQIITKRGRARGGFTQTISAEHGVIEPNFTPPANFATCEQEHIDDPDVVLCQGKEPGDIISDNPLVRYGAFSNGSANRLGWSLRGGGERYAISMSLGRTDEDGTLPSNGYSRTSGRLNVDFFPTEDLRLEAGFGLIRAYTRLPDNDNSVHGYMGGGYLGSPLDVGSAQDGWYGSNRQVEAISQIENEDVSWRIQPRITVNYTPIDGFTNRLTVGGDLTRTQAREFWPRNEIGWYSSADHNAGDIGETRQSVNRLTIDYLGNYALPLTDFLRTDLSFGMQALVNQFDETEATGIGLASNAANAVDAAAETSGGQDFDEDRSYGVFGQAQFSIVDRLYLQFAGRLDEHSSFGAESEAFFSPKVGLSYVISDEAFWPELTGDWINTLRLRGAYGTTGRAPTSGARATYGLAPYAVRAGQIQPGIIPENPGNSELRPERGREYELGFEAGFLDERVGLEVTYFDKKTTDLILERPLAPSQGYDDDPFVNIGSVLNRGFEVALDARLVTLDNFGWEVFGSFNTLHNEILSLGDIEPFGDIRAGFPIDGAFTHRIRSVNVEDGVVVVSDTLEFVGNSLPGREATFASTMNFFGNLRLYAQVDYRGDFYQERAGHNFRDRQFRNSETWHRRNDPEFMSAEERLRHFGPFVTESGDDIGFGEVEGTYLHRSDYTRLREVSLSYDVPRNLVQGYLRASGATLTLAGRNLALWTEFPGDDPESRYGDTSEFFTVPVARRWIARVNFRF